MTRARQPLAERFWPKVVRDPGGCWLWVAGTKPEGYGSIRRGGRGSEQMPAHRASWELTYGPIPPGLFVCHRCDVRACVNPAHLFLGTHEDNMRDMVEKGRACTDQLGGKGHNAKLTDEQAMFIRSEVRSGRATQKEMRLRFGLSKGSVCDISNGRTWTHLPMPLPRQAGAR